MSEDIFRHADRSLQIIYNDMAREFQDLSTEIGFDELNVMEVRRRVNAMYRRMDTLIRREYRKIAGHAYNDAMYEAGVQRERLNAEAFVNGVLKAYDPVSDFVYVREWLRKRDRLFESIIATERGNQEMRVILKRGLDVLSNQVRQYADNITAKARVYAFKRMGADVLVWITEKDDRVCSVCAPRDEQFYPIEMLPIYPAHWHCRCRVDWVDMEEYRNKARWRNKRTSVSHSTFVAGVHPFTRQ